MNLNNKRFKTKENQKGLSSNETLFQYFQNEEMITGTYSGGKIKMGNIVGKQLSEHEIELLYQCLTVEGELLAGQSHGVVTKNEDDLLEIKFEWNWLNGDQSGGWSHYIEVK